MTTPLMDGMLTVPFVGVSEFRASPTWLDTENLIQDGTEPSQDAELYNQLLKASRWAENFCDQPLRAHTVVEQLRCRVNKWGQVMIHPSHNPIRSVTGLAYGSDPSLMTVLTNPTYWIEDQRGLVVSLYPFGASFVGSLEFGSIPPQTMQCYVQIQYVAGYCNTYLTANAAADASSLTVADPTGLTPPATSLFSTSYGASVMRIWDPGLEEAVTVANNYTVGANPVSLAANTANAHSSGCQVSELPAEVRQAVVAYTSGLLCRDDAGEETPFPGSPGPTARRSASGGIAGGLIEEAERLLMPYRRVR